MAKNTYTSSTTSTRTTRRYWRRTNEPRPWWPWGLLPLLGLLALFLFGALATAPAIEDEVGRSVAATLTGAGVSIGALSRAGQHVTARIGEEGPGTALLESLAEASTCDTWAGELRCPAAVALERVPGARVAPEQSQPIAAEQRAGAVAMAAPDETTAQVETLVAERPGIQAGTRHVREACNEALRDTLADSTVQFRTSSAEIDAASEALLQRLTDLVSDCPGVLTIEGHTDSRGDESMNEALSQARAAAVRDALARLGVDIGRMRAVGYGESRPIADNNTAEGRAANRRIVISVDESE